MGKIEKEVLCPKCGRKMSLVAAGYYCMKDDYVIDPLTGKALIRPVSAGYSIGNQKSPVIAAILNFFFSGLGFIYCGTPEYVVGGLITTLLSLINSIILVSYPLPAEIWILSIFASVGWAIIGYGAALSINESISRPSPPTLPTPQPQSLLPKAPQATPQTQIAEMKYCRYCGAQNKTDAVFCEKCGKKIG